MTTVTPAMPAAPPHHGGRQLEMRVRYDDADVERAAEAAGMELSPAERDSILLMLDDDAARLVREGFDAALARFVREEVLQVEAGHRASEDD